MPKKDSAEETIDTIKWAGEECNRMFAVRGIIADYRVNGLDPTKAFMKIIKIAKLKE
jgi:hypothetical protein